MVDPSPKVIFGSLVGIMLLACCAADTKSVGSSSEDKDKTKVSREVGVIDRETAALAQESDQQLGHSLLKILDELVRRKKIKGESRCQDAAA